MPVRISMLSHVPSSDCEVMVMLVHAHRRAAEQRTMTDHCNMIHAAQAPHASTPTPALQYVAVLQCVSACSNVVRLAGLRQRRRHSILVVEYV